MATVHSEKLARAHEQETTAASAGSVFAQNFAVHDCVLIAFHGLMFIAALTIPDGRHAVAARGLATGLLATTLMTIVFVRAEVIPPGRFRGIVYRLGLLVPLVASYFEVGVLLPVLQPPLWDAPLLAVDDAVFGVTPALWLERYNLLPVIEWFSFFYFLYFPLLAGMVLSALFHRRGLWLDEVIGGALLIGAIGHLGYTLVPGVGPYAYDALQFAEPLRGGFFWGLVSATVEHAGSHMDIFPSLHTAFPTFFAIMAWSHRHRSRWARVAWPILAFIALNIMGATMVLRWHYAIDVVVGLALGIGAYHMMKAITRFERGRREGGACQPLWEPF